MLSKAERKLRARAAAYALHAKHDSRELTQAARSAAWKRYLDQVDPGRSLPEAERVRRAESARRSHLLNAARKSAKVRRERSEKKMAASEVAPETADTGRSSDDRAAA